MVAPVDDCDSVDDADMESSKYHTAAMFFRQMARDDGLLWGVDLVDYLARNGFTCSDPRFSCLFSLLRSSADGSGHEYRRLLFDDFMAVVQECAVGVLLERTFRSDLIIPEFEKFCRKLVEVFESVKSSVPPSDGRLPSYIPQLGAVDPALFGVAVCTVDGQQFGIGHVDWDFCVQSCCKPLLYCLALEENGEDAVHRHIGREPSGVAFNSLTLNDQGLPHNPLINSGAIAACSLIKRHSKLYERFDFVMNMWSELSGGAKWGFNNSVCLSEKHTADSNYCLAYMMRGRNSFPEGTDLDDTLDFYFQCCSVETTARKLAVVGATLASGGVCPLTGRKVLNTRTSTNCLSLMYSCGMYDYSGEWAFKIGIPAKSGVSGAIFAVIPNVCSICVFSPPLDKVGNSLRGVEFFKEFSKCFLFHNFDSVTAGRDVDGVKIDPRKSENSGKHFLDIQALYASAEGDAYELRRLFALGVGVDTADYDLRTLLHLAACERRVNIVEMLIRRGVYINPMDRWGRTPLDDAFDFGTEDIIAILKKSGGKRSTELQAVNDE